MVVATLSDTGYPDGYTVSVPNDARGDWREVFSSDATIYGGAGLSNEGEISAANGELTVKVPARGFVVLRHMPR